MSQIVLTLRPRSCELTLAHQWRRARPGRRLACDGLAPTPGLEQAMKRYAAMVCLTCSLFLGTPAFAWNKPGHMVSASLAYRDLKRRDPAKLAAWVDILKQHEHFDRYWKPVLE